jgi:pimeloyl-ACP methyl ester carboxylesterase
MFERKVYLLHGALGFGEQFNPFLKNNMSSSGLEVLELPHHGKNAPCENIDFDTISFANWLIDKVKSNNSQPSLLFGYSMGGYIGLIADAICPGIFSKILTLGTKLEWDSRIADKEIQYLNPDFLSTKQGSFYQNLQVNHILGANYILENTATLMHNLGQNNLIDSYIAKCTAKTIFCVGDSDRMVSIRETAYYQKQHSNSQLCVLPDVKHPIDKLPEYHFNYLLNHLITC